VKGRRGSRRGFVGRGAAGNPKNRFERIEVEPDLDELDPVEPRRENIYLRDHSRSIIARNGSPDIGFDASINPYRGCEHGCIYCTSSDTLILMADGTTKYLEDVLRGGRLSDPYFGSRMRGEGLFADHIAQLFSISCQRASTGTGRFPKLSTTAFFAGGAKHSPGFLTEPPERFSCWAGDLPHEVCVHHILGV
jgi:hypothetical protein